MALEVNFLYQSEINTELENKLPDSILLDEAQFEILLKSKCIIFNLDSESAYFEIDDYESILEVKHGKCYYESVMLRLINYHII